MPLDNTKELDQGPVCMTFRDLWVILLVLVLVLLPRIRASIWGQIFLAWGGRRDKTFPPSAFSQLTCHGSSLLLLFCYLILFSLGQKDTCRCHWCLVSPMTEWDKSAPNWPFPCPGPCQGWWATVTAEWGRGASGWEPNMVMQAGREVAGSGICDESKLQAPSASSILPSDLTYKTQIER